MLKVFKKNLIKNKEIYLRIKVNPGMSKTEIKEVLDDDTIKINIAAPPEKGRANKELIKFLANEFLSVSDNIKILSGAGDRLKLIKIKN